MGRKWGSKAQEDTVWVQKVGKELTVSSDVLNLESPAKYVIFHERRQVIIFGQKVGKESTISSGIPGDSSPIVITRGDRLHSGRKFFRREERLLYIWTEGGEGKHSIFRYIWRVQPNHFP